MADFDHFTLGAHIPGDSPLHRLDARLKLAGLPLLMVAVFSAAGAARLVCLAGAALVLLAAGRISPGRWWRSIRVLKWLLLFTVLVHLLFSPGRTLAGIAWLSQDGLQRGLLVASQLVLAVTFSSLLTLSTSPRELAGALASLLSPLRRWLPVRETVLQFLLVIRFIPILREEAAAQLAMARQAGEDPARGSLPVRLRALGRLVAPLLLRLVDRADALARAAAGGEDIWGENDLPKPQARTADRWALLAGSFILVALFGWVP